MPEAVALEIEDERVIYTKEQANAILERLYKAGKIPPEEMYVNPDFETPGKSFVHILTHTYQHMHSTHSANTHYHPLSPQHYGLDECMLWNEWLTKCPSPTSTAPTTPSQSNQRNAIYSHR